MNCGPKMAEYPIWTAFSERVQFRLFVMPCCGQLLCWVNPRLPTYCPECSKMVLRQLRTGEHTQINGPATLRVDGVNNGRK